MCINKKPPLAVLSGGPCESVLIRFFKLPSVHKEKVADREDDEHHHTFDSRKGIIRHSRVAHIFLSHDQVKHEQESRNHQNDTDTT